MTRCGECKRDGRSSHSIERDRSEQAQDEKRSNLMAAKGNTEFYRVRIEGHTFSGVMSADGPYISCQKDGSSLTGGVVLGPTSVAIRETTWLTDSDSRGLGYFASFAA
jgi:hypothetical protein